MPYEIYSIIYKITYYINIIYYKYKYLLNITYLKFVTLCILQQNNNYCLINILPMFKSLDKENDILHSTILFQLSVREAELAGAVEERDRARCDLKDLGGLARDEMVRKAWEVRDGAVARKNATQVELARTRIDVLQANSQLMEAIQQKVELSQQLEQWQVSI